MLKSIINILNSPVMISLIPIIFGTIIEYFFSKKNHRKHGNGEYYFRYSNYLLFILIYPFAFSFGLNSFHSPSSLNVNFLYVPTFCLTIISFLLSVGLFCGIMLKSEKDFKIKSFSIKTLGMTGNAVIIFLLHIIFQNHYINSKIDLLYSSLSLSIFIIPTSVALIHFIKKSWLDIYYNKFIEKFHGVINNKHIKVRDTDLDDLVIFGINYNLVRCGTPLHKLLEIHGDDERVLFFTDKVKKQYENKKPSC